MLGGSSQKVSAQVAVRIYPLAESAAKKAAELSQFYVGDSTIRYDTGKKVVFEMRCCSDSTMDLYFPVYDESTGKRKDCCPVLTLFTRNGKYFTDNMPSEGSTYAPKETEKQVELIKRALESLKKMSNQNEKIEKWKQVLL